MQAALAHLESIIDYPNERTNESGVGAEPNGINGKSREQVDGQFSDGEESAGTENDEKTSS